MCLSHKRTFCNVCCFPARRMVELVAVLVVGMLWAGRVLGAEKVPTFENPVLFATQPDPWGLACADADESGYPDVAVTHSGGKIVIYLNTGDWSDPQQGLQLSQTLSVPGQPDLGEAQFADMNGDQHLDLVVAGMWHAGLYVFRADDQNPGHYTTEPTHTYPLSHRVYGLVVADLDNDGWKDVALAATENDSEPDVDKVIFMWNQQNGQLGDEQVFDLRLDPGHYPMDLVVGHFTKNPGQLP